VAGKKRTPFTGEWSDGFFVAGRKFEGRGGGKTVKLAIGWKKRRKEGLKRVSAVVKDDDVRKCGGEFRE